MSAPHLPRGGRPQDPPPATSPGWLSRLARLAVPEGDDAAGPLKLLRRITRAQKVIVGLGTLGIVFAVATAFLSDGQSAMVRRAHVTAVGLQIVVIMGGSLFLWLTVSWRLGRFPVFALVGCFVVGGLFSSVLSITPMATLVGWMVIATLAIIYIHFYRKGRFGYTRGATAAAFSHLALMIFFAGFPFALLAVLSDVDAPVSPWNMLPDTDMTQPTHQAEHPASGPALPYFTGGGGRGWRIIDDGLVQVVTDATSPADLRALFDDQYGNLHRYAGGNEPKMWRVRIRCASVADLSGVDPTLATGHFVVSNDTGIYTIEELRAWADRYSAAGDTERAEWAADYAATLQQAGLTATDDFLLEISERDSCDPLPPPANAVTSDEVIAAAHRVGLRVTNPRDGSEWCYALGCVQRILTDQFTIIVWPTPQAAERWEEMDPGYVAVLLGVPVGAAVARYVPRHGDVVVFGPSTTAHVEPGVLEEEFSIVGDVDDEHTRYRDALISAATLLDRSRGAATEESG